ncbi:MAG: S-adenosylmethionine decarboxylase [Patescibacteria group bacterium]
MENNESINYFGPHLMVDGYKGNQEKLGDMRLVFKVLNELPGLIDMHKISAPYVFIYDGGQKPEDWGVTGSVIIAESHICIHTFPNKGFVSFDVYSCKTFNKEVAIKYFKDTFELQELEINFVQRGKQFAKT